MRADVARLIADGQDLSLFGDNLLVELDLSVENLPAGTRLRIGTALCEVTPLPIPAAASSPPASVRTPPRRDRRPHFRPLAAAGDPRPRAGRRPGLPGDPVQVVERET